MFIDSHGFLRDDSYLAHHGILGQKWGKRNGPPYPLGAGAHSASEKKAGWRRSLNRSGTSGVRYGAQAKSNSNDSSKDKPDKKKKDSNTIEAGFFLTKMALDIVALQPISLAFDTKRLIDYGRSKVKQAFENKRISKLDVDAKTGFHLKDKEMTPEEDMKHINPQFKNFDTNTKNNCMLCTTAYELRRRGYDVQAGTTTRGYQNKDVLEWFPKAKLESAYSTDMTTVKDRAASNLKVAFGIGGKEKYKKLSESLLKHGDGARGNLMVTWDAKGGHSIVWENQNGSIILRDCQSGKMYKSERQIASLLSGTYSATYVRTDNVDFDKKKVKELVR